MRWWPIALFVAGCIRELPLETLRFPCAESSDCLADHRCDSTGTCVPRDAPEPDAGSAPVPEIIDVAIGNFHTCVLIAGGEVRCFGDNSWGQLGSGSSGPGSERPAIVSGLGRVVQIGAGRGHTCALEENGDVRCWGLNEYGECGAAHRQPVLSPSPPIVRDAVAIAIGRWESSCALLRSGEVLCWGFRLNGQSWGGPEADVIPRSIPFNGTIDDLTVGGYHACGVTADRSVECFGNNYHGQLGDGTVDPRASPIVVSLPASLDMLSLGDLHSCGIFAGRIHCWGAGSMVDGRPDLAVPEPLEISIGGAAAEVVSAFRHTCARFESGNVRCWGMTEYGRVGGGDGEYASPRPIEGLDGHRVRRIFGGWSHTCAQLEEGEVRCWGYNHHGQLGRLPLTDALPVAMPIEF